MTVRTVKLGDVIEINPRSSHALTSDSNVAFLAMADISEDGQILATQTRQLSEVAKGYTSFKNGDVLLAKITPCFENGKAALVHGMFSDVAFGSTEFHVLRPTKEVEGRYLYHLVWNPGFRIAGAQRMTGSAGQKRVPAAFLSDFEIALPSFEEQKHIAAILDKADSLRRKRHEALAQLDSLAKSIFVEMFESEHSAKWGMTTVGDVALPNGGMRTGPFGSQLLHSEFVESGVAVLGIDNAVSNEFRWGERRYITESKYTELKRYTVKPGDVIITIMGTCGRCAVIPENIPTAINTKHLCCITLDTKKCLPHFLHAFFLQHSSARKYLAQKAKGAIMSGLNMGIIKEMPIPLAPLSLQHEYVEFQHEIHNVKLEHRSALAELDRLFSSLQHRAFSEVL